MKKKEKKGIEIALNIIFGGGSLLFSLYYIYVFIHLKTTYGNNKTTAVIDNIDNIDCIATRWSKGSKSNSKRIYDCSLNLIYTINNTKHVNNIHVLDTENNINTIYKKDQTIDIRYDDNNKKIIVDKIYETKLSDSMIMIFIFIITFIIVIINYYFDIYYYLLKNISII
jgi:hypothetical protein